MDPITVLIVDDHTMVREGLRVMLDSDERVQVVGEAADGFGAVDLEAALNPNVVLMDIRMPGMDGLAAMHQILAAHPSATVILLTNYDDAALVVNGLLGGAAGYLLKDVSRDLLVHTLAAVADGGTAITSTLLHKALNTLAHTGQRAHASSEGNGVDEVTPREQEVLQLVADGRSNKEIADALSLAEVTVKKHIQSIVAKLGATDRTQAATTALRIGLIQ